MEAKLKSSYPIAVIRALEGREYTKTEWRPVPAEREAEAQRHPDLETRVPEPVPAVAEPPAQPAEPAADQIGPIEPREHVTDGTPCWCDPEIQDVEGSDVKVVVHRDQGGELIPESRHPLGQPHDQAEEEKMRAAVAGAISAEMPAVEGEPAGDSPGENAEPKGKGRGKKAKE